MKILILSSNPRNDLDLDEEIRDLKEVIDDSRNRQNFEVEDALAVRAGDLHELFFRHEPQIVHFCGHGGGQPGLAFEGRDGGEQWVGTEALRDLFRLFSNRVTCVLLNACYSEQQANEIVHHIDYVIGMNQAIRDDAAIAFSKGFYRALGYNCSIEEAYEFGCNAIQLELSGGSISRDGTPVERKLQGVTDPNVGPALPEHLKPILKKRIKTQPQPLPLPAAERQQLQKEVVQAVTGFVEKPKLVAIPQSTPLPKPILAAIAAGVAFLVVTIGFVLLLKRQTPDLPPTVSSGIIKKPSDSKPSIDDGSEAILAELSGLVNEQRCKAAIELIQKTPANNPATKDPSFQANFENCSDSLFYTAQDHYVKDSIDEALSTAKLVPKDAKIYSKAQSSIAAWTKEKKAFKDLIKILSQTQDTAKAKGLLEKITNPELRSQAEDRIQAIDDKIKPKKPIIPETPIEVSPLPVVPPPISPEPKISPKPKISPEPPTKSDPTVSPESKPTP
jgi:hypothetical protein